MRLWLLHTAGALILGMILTILPDCRGNIESVKIVNESLYPLTSVKVAAYSENEAAQADALDLARNLLPTDAEGYTIALDSGRTESASVKIRKEDVIGAVTFYVEGVYQEYVQYAPADLSDAPENAILVLRVVRDDVNAARIYFEYE